MMRSHPSLLMDGEEKKKKEELMKLFFKEKLRRESGNARLNEIKVNQKWRALLREGKTAELRTAIDIMQETFQSVLKHKDQLIVLLQQDLEEANIQHRRLFSSHLQNLEEMIELKSKRAKFVRDNFHSRLNTLILSYEDQSHKLMQEHQEHMNCLSESNQIEKQKFKGITNETALKYTEQEEELVENDLEEKQILETNMERRLNTLWQKLQDTLQLYISKTSDRSQVYQDLQIRSKQNKEQISAQRKELRSINDSINHLKQSIEQTEDAYRKNNSQLKIEKESLRATAVELKNQVLQTEQRERAALRKLVCQSDRVLETLQSKCEITTRIQKLGWQMKKLEDEMPLLEIPIADENPSENATVSLPKEFFTECGSLVNFWKRYNEVVLQNIAFQKELNLLSMENKKIQQRTKDKILHWTSGDYLTESQLERLHHVNLGKPTVLNATDLLHQLR